MVDQVLMVVMICSVGEVRFREVEVREPGLVMDGFCAALIGGRVEALVPRTRNFAVCQQHIVRLSSHLVDCLFYYFAIEAILTDGS